MLGQRWCDNGANASAFAHPGLGSPRIRLAKLPLVSILYAAY